MTRRRICALLALACALAAPRLARVRFGPSAAAESLPTDAVATCEPTPGPTGTTEPTAPPTESPGPVPTEATGEPTATPTQAPSPEPTPEPTAYPTLQPGSAGDEVKALQARLIELKYLDGAIAGMPTGAFDKDTETAVKLFQKQNGVTETGVADDATQQLLYAPDARAYEGVPPGEGGRPGGGFSGGGGFPGGGGSAGGGFGGASADGAMIEEPGGVIPGEALTGDHTSGDRDMAKYWALELTVAEGARSRLVLGGTALDIALLNGEFIAAVDEGKLTLASETGTLWEINGYALKLLSISGVESVTLVSGGESVVIPTERYLSGSAYAALRAQGLVSKDFTLLIALSGGAAATVTAAGQTYGADGVRMSVGGLDAR